MKDSKPRVRIVDMGDRKYTILGTSDEVTTCDCCGKKNLRITVALEPTDGSGDVYYGRICAARALGWGDTIDDGKRVQKIAARREEKRREEAEKAAYVTTLAAMEQFVFPKVSPALDGDRAEWHAKYVERDGVTRVIRSVIRWQRYTDGSERQTESLVFWIEEFKGSPADALNTMAARAARSEKPFAAIRWMRPNDKSWSP